MEGFHIISLSVNGIKTLDKEIKLSFYKKTISASPDFQNYNIKGIYGTNGSGKTAIVSAVKIFKSIMINPNYMRSDLNQQKLRELINKSTKTLSIEVEFLVELTDEKSYLYRYRVNVALDEMNAFGIRYEKLERKNATSRSVDYSALFEIEEGRINLLNMAENSMREMVISKTANLLEKSSFCSLFCTTLLRDKKVFSLHDKTTMGCVVLFLFSNSLYTYLDDKDQHDDYLLNELLINFSRDKQITTTIKQIKSFCSENDFSIVEGRNVVKEEQYEAFISQVKQLEQFISIFKSELQRIDVDGTKNNDEYICRIILQYDGYSIDSEFESTGIKKLIRLHQYIQKMCSGNVVFIDELDANLHDVYLCALLEYLSEYAKGQLCFTSHNIGPMRVLRHKKKSIDFLSEDKSIYSWSTSGNYSPTDLYMGGMIKGSPFNVDLTDFIGVFETEGET